MKTIAAGAALLMGILAAGQAFAQGEQAANLRRQLEAGRYTEVVRAVEATEAAANASGYYTAAEAYQRLNQNDRAVELYERLAQLPEGNPWRLIGMSARDLAQGDVQRALEEARQAVEQAPGLPEAHYQLGMVLARLEHWAEAAAAFDRAVQIDPNYAYAHYRAGMMHYRARRIDQMANAFEIFLKLAPEAPERPEVQQIMRTVRGR